MDEYDDSSTSVKPSTHQIAYILEYLSSKEGLKKGGGKGEKEGGGEGEKEKEKGRIHGNDILLGRHQSSQCDPVNE